MNYLTSKNCDLAIRPHPERTGKKITAENKTAIPGNPVDVALNFTIQRLNQKLKP